MNPFAHQGSATKALEVAMARHSWQNMQNQNAEEGPRSANTIAWNYESAFSQEILPQIFMTQNLYRRYSQASNFWAPPAATSEDFHLPSNILVEDRHLAMDPKTVPKKTIGKSNNEANRWSCLAFLFDRPLSQSATSVDSLASLCLHSSSSLAAWTDFRKIHQLKLL